MMKLSSTPLLLLGLLCSAALLSNDALAKKRSSGDSTQDAITLLVPKADYLWSVYTDHRGTRQHNAIDIAARGGARIKTVEPGVVVFRGRGKTAGRWVEIEHADGRRTRYMHLRGIRVREGQEVRRGQCVGTVGRTGNAWKVGHHLHYEVLQSGTQIDPMPYLVGHARQRYRKVTY